MNSPRKYNHTRRSIGFTYLGSADRMVGDVGAALYYRIDAIVDRGNGHDLDIVPGVSGARKAGVEMKPDGNVGRIFSGHTLALDVVDGFDRRIFFDHHAHRQWRTAHDQPRVRHMRQRIFAAYFQSRGPLVREAHFDGIDDAKIELTVVEQRQKSAAAGIGLNSRLNGCAVADDTGQTAGYGIENRPSRICTDRYRLGQLLGPRRSNQK